MIFEFFKRLFWKADEGNRKRKANELLPYTEDNNLYPKKRCCDFVSSHHVKIISASNSNNNCNNEYDQMDCDSQSHSSLNLSDKFNKAKRLETTSSWPVTLKMNSKNKNFVPTKDFGMKSCESLSQCTIYKTHRLNEKKQYSEMLSNFIPSKRENVENIEFSDTMKQQCIVKTLNISKSKMESSAYTNDVTRTYEQRFSKPWCFLDTSASLKLHYQKPNRNLRNEFEVIKEENSSQLGSRHVPIEIIKTNTLRDKFLNKDVIRHDFITQMTKKYNDRTEQCNKEAEELKKMTYTLSKYNRIKREAALEDHLNRSMKLCEAVLDENDLLSESKLPELDRDMIDRIKWALSAGPIDEILVQEFGLRIARKDIQTLAGLNWLNDEVINFYMNLLIVRGTNKGYPSVYAMNTFFYPKLVSGGHVSLKRWTRKVDIFAKDLIVIPIHLEIHWCMSIIDFRNKSICYYDSMGSPNYKCLQVLKQYLYDESMDKKKESFDFVDWNFQCVKDIPQQMNGSDCGVFSCMFAEYICANKSLNFSQEDMPYFRNKMIYEILTAKLL